MAVYKINMEGLAQYLSNTEFRLKPNKVVSTVGTRTNGDSTYKISVQEIISNSIVPKIDCFLNENERLQIQVRLPGYKYTVETNELSPTYKSSLGLSFDFIVTPRSFVWSITKQSLNNFQDIQKVADDLLEAIEQHVSEDMNKFRGNSHEWTFEGIDANIKFSAYPSANHEEDDLYEENSSYKHNTFLPFQ